MPELTWPWPTEVWIAGAILTACVLLAFKPFMKMTAGVAGCLITLVKGLMILIGIVLIIGAICHGILYLQK